MKYLPSGQWGFKLSVERLFSLLLIRFLLLRQSDLSRGPEIVPGRQSSPARHNTRGCRIAGISSCCHSMVLGFSSRQVVLGKTLLILKCASSRCENPKPLLSFCLDDTFLHGAIFMEGYLCVTDLPDHPEGAALCQLNLNCLCRLLIAS